MKAKSALERYLSSQTFWATKSEQRMSGRQLVGCKGISVKAINLFIYTKQIMQHSGLYKKNYCRDIFLPELSTVIESFNELEDVFDTGSLSQQCNSLLIKRFWFLENVFFF